MIIKQKYKNLHVHFVGKPTKIFYYKKDPDEYQTDEAWKQIKMNKMMRKAMHLHKMEILNLDF